VLVDVVVIADIIVIIFTAGVVAFRALLGR